MDFQTGRKGSLAEESMRIANGILMRSTSSPYPKPTGKAKDEAKGKDQKKGVSVSVYVDCIWMHFVHYLFQKLQMWI